MKTSTLRIVVVLATLSSIGIAVIQIYWIRKAFDIKQADFDREVNTALLSVAQQFFKINDTPSPANNPVVRLSTNYYAVLLNSHVNPNLLEFLLQTEFEKRNIKVDFEYGIYDCSREVMVYGNYISFDKTKHKPDLSKLPTLANASYYFGVRFPDREAQLIDQMGIWKFSSIVLLLVIIFFAYTLFVIFKQKRLSEIQKDFINNMTHEFKTPLSTISLSAEALKQQAHHSNPDRLINYTSIIEQEIKRLQEHLERILQVARIDNSTADFKREEINIHEIITDTVTNFEPSILEKNATVSLYFNSQRPTLKGDRHHITNMVFNLLDNALKYTPQHPVITISTIDTAHGIFLNVTDTGIGISKENHRKIFQKFYRVPTGNIHTVKGFGLGLSYVKQIVEILGGTISIKSKLNEGSEFSIFLPTNR